MHECNIKNAIKIKQKVLCNNKQINNSKPQIKNDITFSESKSQTRNNKKNNKKKFSGP